MTSVAHRSYLSQTGRCDRPMLRNNSAATSAYLRTRAGCVLPMPQMRTLSCDPSSSSSSHIACMVWPVDPRHNKRCSYAKEKGNHAGQKWGFTAPVAAIPATGDFGHCTTRGRGGDWYVQRILELDHDAKTRSMALLWCFEHGGQLFQGHKFSASKCLGRKRQKQADNRHF